jgi:hypothetical protein
MDDAESHPQPATWRIVLAALLDFFTSFIVAGTIVAYFSGNMTSTGWQLNGMAAFITLILAIAYFPVFDKFLGGTIWKRILRAKR